MNVNYYASCSTGMMDGSVCFIMWVKRRCDSLCSHVRVCILVCEHAREPACAWAREREHACTCAQSEGILQSLNSLLCFRPNLTALPPKHTPNPLACFHADLIKMKRTCHSLPEDSSFPAEIFDTRYEIYSHPHWSAGLCFAGFLFCVLLPHSSGALLGSSANNSCCSHCTSQSVFTGVGGNCLHLSL